MLRLMVKPKDGKEGVIMFVKSYKRNWLFRKKIKLTPLIGEAMVFDLNETVKAYEMKIEINDIAKTEIVYDSEINYYRKFHQFYIIAKHTKKGLEYYSSEKEFYDERLKRRVQMPDFTTEIEKAEFSKSLVSVKNMLTRMRVSNKDKVASYSVFLTIRNDLYKPNIIFVLTNKKTKNVYFLKKYTLKGKKNSSIQVCDNMQDALSVKYDEALKIYDDLHAKHKNFSVNCHLRKDNENVNAKDFKFKREFLQIGFKLKV